MKTEPCPGTNDPYARKCGNDGCQCPKPTLNMSAELAALVQVDLILHGKLTPDTQAKLETEVKSEWARIVKEATQPKPYEDPQGAME